MEKTMAIKIQRQHSNNNGKTMNMRQSTNGGDDMGAVGSNSNCNCNSITKQEQCHAAALLQGQPQLQKLKQESHSTTGLMETASYTVALTLAVVCINVQLVVMMTRANCGEITWLSAE